jgi:valyl-tRNA synthetase
MPFLTEEIWQTLVADATSIMVSEFPAADEAFSDPEAEEEMAQIMEVITRIRNIRGEMNVAPSLKLKVTLMAPSAALRMSLERGRAYIANLANLERLEITGEMVEPKGAATAVAGPVHVYVFLAGVIDIDGEKGRLGKEIGKVEKELAVVAMKLANPDFLAKAAEAVVKKEQQKARVFGEKRAALDAALQRIASIDAGG